MVTYVQSGIWTVQSMKILIAYDGSSYAEAAIEDLRWAGLPARTQAIVLSAVEVPIAPRSWGMVETSFGAEWTEQLSQTERLAQAGCNRVQSLFPQWDVKSEVAAGHAASVILEKAAAWKADLIVVGTHGRSGIARVLLGSVSLNVLKQAQCSVRVVRPRTHEGPLRLLIGVDGSAEADAVVDEICRRTWPTDTEVRVLSVHEMLIPVHAEQIAVGQQIYDEINVDEQLRLETVASEASRKLQERGLLVSSEVMEGRAKEILVGEALAWHADTLFIGARGLGRIESFLLGSVSSASVAHAPCSVEVIRILE
jgi:nucleotide-binding universal stress UspA family protein